jgi:hypothetical protein
MVVLTVLRAGESSRRGAEQRHQPPGAGQRPFGPCVVVSTRFMETSPGCASSSNVAPWSAVLLGLWLSYARKTNGASPQTGHDAY